MIVDSHLHIWRKIDGRTEDETPVVPLSGGMIRIGDSELLGMPPTHLDCSARAEWVLAEFDAAGVDVGVIVQEYLDGPQNDYLLEVSRQHPNRFFMHALPDFFRPDQVADEAFELFDGGFRGLKLCAGHLSGKVALDDDRLMPIWARMAEQDLVLAVDLAAGDEQVPMMEKILSRHPALRVAVGHFGMVGRTDWMKQIRLAEADNVWIESGGITWLFRHEGPPFPGAQKAIRQAARAVGIGKLMWGSDYPRTMVDFTYRQTLDFVRDGCAFLSAPDKRRFLGDNARRVYGLKAPAKPRRPIPRITES